MKSLFVSVVLSCAAAFSPTAFSEIIIGQSAPLSGKNADMGNDIRRGAMAWFNSVNAKGGVNGQKITLITLDDGNDAKQAGENAKILVDKKHATALFGFASATLSAPALPLVQQRGIAMFAPFSGADLLRKQTANVFTIRASYRDEMKGILDIWQGYFKTLVVVFYDDAVGKQNFEAVSEILRPSGFIPQGVAIKRNEKIGPEVTAKIESYKPQLILFTTLSDPIVNIVRSLKAQRGFYHLASLSFAGPDILKNALGIDGRGMAIATVVPIYTSVGLPIVLEYERAMLRDSHTEMSYTSLEAYIAAKVLTEGLKHAPPNPTRAGLVKSLESLNKYDVGGFVVSFAPGDNHGSDFVNVAVISGNGKFR